MLRNNKKGSIVTLVLVFGSIFLILFGGLLGFILLQLRISSQKVAWNESLHIAESGVHYYLWCLNNEVEAQCETEKEYLDPAGNPIGRFSLNITTTISCGETINRTINSTGWTYDFPDIQREIKVLYGKSSVAKYAYLINDNTWAGADREIRGLYHSNGGIRMDGENQSLVTSARDDWVCTSSFGCSTCPTTDGCWIDGLDCVCPGVFTTTTNSDVDLFDFPVPPFDFEGITIDLAQMKTLSQTEPGGIYLPPSTDINPEGEGYHIIFQNNGTFEAWIITELQATWGYNLTDGWHDDYFTISSEFLYNSYSIDPACSLIFIEDDIWPEGQVKGKVTIASANLISPTEDTDVVLQNNINYTTLDGSDGLALIGERDVLISPDSPDIMELRGVFIAQKGHFGRNHYSGNIRERLEIYGSIVSNGRVGTQWTSGSVIVSGYRERENYFDSHLVYSPPPFVPYASSEFEIANWEEVE
jgi:hypothetical protein